MQYPAIVVANQIIKFANSDNVIITPMKLQKILYLANGICCKRLGEKLINEPFEAWEYGPVVSSVYYLYRDYKGNNIKKPVEDLIYTGGYSSQLSSKIDIDEPHLKIIREAWDSAKNLDAFTLSAWSHNKNSPWDKAFNATPKAQFISDEEIKSYFNEFIKN